MISIYDQSWIARGAIPDDVWLNSQGREGGAMRRSGSQVQFRLLAKNLWGIEVDDNIYIVHFHLTGVH
jgi:hypothetical protein